LNCSESGLYHLYQSSILFLSQNVLCLIYKTTKPLEFRIPVIYNNLCCRRYCHVQWTWISVIDSFVLLIVRMFAPYAAIRWYCHLSDWICGNELFIRLWLTCPVKLIVLYWRIMWILIFLLRKRGCRGHPEDVSIIYPGNTNKCAAFSPSYLIGYSFQHLFCPINKRFK
jgi:hypothetical protein